MTPTSPFLQDRFEHDREHLYHLPKHLFERIEQKKPVYLIGSRGTGKTTLLMALNWRERLFNQGLKTTLGPNPFDSGCIGVYLKLPEYKLLSFDLWLKDEAHDRYGTILGVYFDLLILEVLLDGIAGLSTAEVLQITPEDEMSCIHDILQHQNVGGLRLASGKTSPTSFRQLKTFMEGQREVLEKHAECRTPVGEVLTSLPSGQIGTLSRSISQVLAGVCSRRPGRSRPHWYFKPCLDEGETLTPRQQTVLNTAVRLTAWPLFPVVAFVREPLDATQTLATNLTLAQADRDLIPLDDTDDPTFRALAEGVGAVRLAAFTHTPQKPFNVQRILGELNINGLLEGMLRSSVSPEGRRLINLAKQLAGEGSVNSKGSRARIRGRESIALPIYQAYLIDRLNLASPNLEAAAWQRRRKESAELRKKMVAAYLSICRELGLEVRYASADMVFQMCDKRIRDFLSFMHEIYLAKGVAASKFAKCTVTTAMQHQALVRASENKRNNLKTSGVAEPSPTIRLINGLGVLTRIVQTEGQGYRHLVASERGFFHLDYSHPARGETLKALGYLREAAEAGYLHLPETAPGSWGFRVHTSLAAAFKFSYRGAYYPTPILAKDLVRLYAEEDADAHARFVQELGGRLSGNDTGTASLFEDTNA